MPGSFALMYCGFRFVIFSEQNRHHSVKLREVSRQRLVLKNHFRATATINLTRASGGCWSATAKANDLRFSRRRAFHCSIPCVPAAYLSRLPQSWSSCPCPQFARTAGQGRWKTNVNEKRRVTKRLSYVDTKSRQKPDHARVERRRQHTASQQPPPEP
jgi:hypothetical protein